MLGPSNITCTYTGTATGTGTNVLMGTETSLGTVSRNVRYHRPQDIGAIGLKEFSVENLAVTGTSSIVGTVQYSSGPGSPWTNGPDFTVGTAAPAIVLVSSNERASDWRVVGASSSDTSQAFRITAQGVIGN